MTRVGRAGQIARVSLGAVVAALEGRRDEALSGFREAVRGMRDVGAIWHASQIGLAFALAIGPSDPEARTAAEEARDVFARVGARPWLEKADAILNGEVPPILGASPIPAEAPTS